MKILQQKWRDLTVADPEESTPQPHNPRTHLSNGQPYRAEPKAIKTGPKRTPKNPLGMVPERLDFRVSSGAIFASFRSSPIGLSI